MKQSIVAVNRQALESTVLKDVELPAQPQALRQIVDVEARGGQLSDCEYGPTNPDSTGSETVTFWYKEVPISMADFLKLSRKHPLAKFGDAAVTTCPATLADARQKFGESRRLGQSHVDPSVLPAAHIPLTVLGKERYAVYQDVKKSWMSYQATHDPRDQQQAIAGKSQLLGGYEQACERMKAAGQPPNNVHCQIAQQLADEFRDIPNSPETANAPTARVPGPAAGAQVPPATGSPLIPAGTQLAVTTIDAIDLLTQDESLRYRAQLERPALSRGQTVLAQGSEVLLKISRQNLPKSPDNMAFVALTVDSTTLDGKLIQLTSRAVVKLVPVHGTTSRTPTEIPPGTKLLFIVQQASNGRLRQVATYECNSLA
jgi:hypothetical protein